jgi:ketopantoate reductase
MADKTSSDKDWKNGDCIISQRSTATLSKAFQALIADILSKAGAQAEFDKDIFTRLVDKIIIKNRDNIIFLLKDGTELKRVL